MVKYIITYENGFKQNCNLLSEEEYNVLKGHMNNLYVFEVSMQNINKKRPLYKELFRNYTKLKKTIGSYGNWFVKDSPLGRAIFDGSNIMRLPKHQGGNHKIEWITEKGFIVSD